MNAVNQRQIIFATIPPFATRLVNALAATNATDEKVENAKSINRKIQGGSKATTTPASTEPTDPNNPTPPARHNSTSKQSTDGQIEEITKLIELVKAESSYSPNEDDLKPTGLDALLINLSNSNTEVINTSTALSNARIARDKFLYTEDTGLVSVALDVKKYIKSVFGASSLEYKQVTSIPFKNTGAE
jgi:hypothetical protein